MKLIKNKLTKMYVKYAPVAIYLFLYCWLSYVCNKY